MHDMNKTTFDGYLRAKADQAHPLQTNVEFVFTDFSPNKNKQGVPRDEADNLLRYGINMPIKARFVDGKIKGHDNSVPVGPIISMEQRDDTVIGHGIIWKDEFAELTEYLEKASASESGVHFSWELYHKDSEVDEAGITWLRNCVVAGIAIVADPAYAGRTPLLALAEEDLAEQVKNLEQEIAELRKSLPAQSNGSQPMDLEQLQALIEQKFTDLNQRLSALEAAPTPDVQGETNDGQDTEEQVVLDPAVAQELEDLRKFKNDAEAEKARTALASTRKGQLKDIMSDEEFTARADFLLGLTDEQFSTFKESLVTVASKSKSTSSKWQVPSVPEPLGGAGDSNLTLPDLAEALRSYRSTK